MVKGFKGLIKKSLKRKLVVIFFIVSIIPLVILGTVSYVIMSNNILKEFNKRAAVQIMSGVGNSEKWFEEIESKIYSLNTNQYTQKYLLNNDKGSMITYDQILILTSRIEALIGTASDRINTFIMLPMDNRISPIFKGDYILGEMRDYYDIPIVKEAIKNNNFLVWGKLRNRANSDLYIVAAQTIVDPFSEKVIGVTIMGFNSKEFSGISEEILSNENEYLFVMDENDEILYESEENAANKFYSGSIRGKIKDHEEQMNYPIRYHKDAYRLFVSETRVNGIKIFYVVPEKNILGKINSYPKIVMGLLGIFCIFVTGFAFYVYGDVYGPIRELSSAMNKFNEDTQYIHVHIDREDELGGLANYYNILIDTIQSLITKVENEGRLKKDFEIKALQAQITPHFLYNTLNSIKVMARAGKTEDISSMTTALIRLLYVSASYTSDYITLEEETTYLKSYIEIMGYHFGQALKIEFPIDPEVKQSYMLRFLLQPIVENAVIHGFKNRIDQECKIIMRAYKSREDLIIEIIDNGEGMASSIEELINNHNEEKQRFSRIGIKNIEDRIKLNFGSQYGIRYESVVNVGTTAIVTLPFLEHKLIN